MDEPSVVLAPRQFEVARLASQGLSNKEIASALNVSVHTVRNTMRVVFERLQVENRVGVANAFASRRVARWEAK